MKIQFIEPCLLRDKRQVRGAPSACQSNITTQFLLHIFQCVPKSLLIVIGTLSFAYQIRVEKVRKRCTFSTLPDDHNSTQNAGMDRQLSLESVGRTVSPPWGWGPAVPPTFPLEKNHLVLAPPWRALRCSSRPLRCAAGGSAILRATMR